MSTPGDVTLSGSINGCTMEGGQIGPISLAYLLSQQKYTHEVKDWPIEAAAVLPGTPRTLNIPTIPAVGGLRQNLFVIKGGLGRVEFTINAGAVTYDLPAGGLFVIAAPAVTSIEFGNPNNFEVKVYVLQVVGT